MIVCVCMWCCCWLAVALSLSLSLSVCVCGCDGCDGMGERNDRLKRAEEWLMKMVHGQLGTHIKPDIKTWNTMLSFCLENTQRTTTTQEKKKKKSEEEREREERKRKEKHEVGRRVIDLMERLGVQGDAITEEKKTLLLKQMRARACVASVV